MKRARGVAAITAILIVAVAASAATMMLGRQSAMLDRTLMITARAQADLYAAAGIDWARGILDEDARRGSADHLNEGWARPIAALPVDRALVSGALVDEQGKLNLNNLMANPQQASAPDVRMFRQLLASLGLSADLADAVLDWIDADDDLAGSAGAESAHYLALARPYRPANAPMAQVEELYRVRGFDARAVAALRPYVTALPVRTSVNVNTAPEPVLAALMRLPLDKARLIAAQRAARPFANRTDFASRMAAHGVGPIDAAYDVASAHFRVTVNVAQDDVHLASEALLQRGSGDNPAAARIVWRRPRY